MHHLFTSIRNAAWCLALPAALLLNACQKTNDTYRNAVPANNTGMFTYDYLRSRTGTFDSLVYLLDKTGLKDTLLEKNITFFCAFGPEYRHSHGKP